jgi:UDP-glucose 4-epimerase
VRFFGGYGPNQNLTWWGGPQSVFINRALDNEEIELHGDGQQTRSFTYITDHVDGIIRVLESDRAINQVFNLGYTREISIEGLARLIWKMVRGDEGPKLKIVPYASFGQYEDVRRRIPNIDKARELLGFEPKVDLEEGLANTIKWQIERRRAHGTHTALTAHLQRSLG